jgi:hypothetical protein
LFSREHGIVTYQRTVFWLSLSGGIICNFSEIKRKYILGGLKAYLRRARTIPLAILLVEICPENLFDESSVLKCDHKGSSKTHLYTIQFIVENTPTMDLNASFDIT